MQAGRPTPADDEADSEPSEVPADGEGTSVPATKDHDPDTSSPVNSGGTESGTVEGRQFAAVLLDYYGYGLTQAKSAFSTAQRFASFGVTILFVGIALAVWRAETSGELYLGIVTSASGTVTMLVGHLFHRRADRALEHMVAQTDKLRDDQRHDANTKLSVELIRQVTNDVVRARLQAALILKLSGAELPDLEVEPNATLPGPTPPPSVESTV